MIGPAGQRAHDLLSVDPGVEYFAWARWQDSTLVEAGLDRDNRYLTNRFPDTTTVVVELTPTRTGDRKKQTHIDGLIRAAGEIAGQFPNRVYGLQTLPKKIFQDRAWDALRPEEREVLEKFKKKDLYHILDAVGYGMKYLRRI